MTLATATPKTMARLLLTPTAASFLAAVAASWVVLHRPVWFSTLWRIVIGSAGRAAQDLDDGVTGREATDGELVAGAGGGVVDDAGDDLVTLGSLDLAQVVGVGEEGLGLAVDVGGRGAVAQADHGVADLVERLGRDVELGRGVVAGQPEGLTVGGGLASREVLLLTLVDWGEGRVSQGVAARRTCFLTHVGESGHGAAVEHLNDGVVLKVVGHAGQVSLSLVGAEVIHHTSQHLTKGKDSSVVHEFRQEAIVDVLGGINAHTIDGVVGNKLLDPLAKHINDRVGLGIQIGQSHTVGVQPAVLVVGRVVPLRDVAVRVIVVLVIEGVEQRVVHGRRYSVVEGLGHVVNDYIDQQVHVTVVKLVGQFDKLICGAKVLVDGVKVIRVVTMVRLSHRSVVLDVVHDRADLNGRKAHVWFRVLLSAIFPLYDPPLYRESDDVHECSLTLDVVQMVDKTRPRSVTEEVQLIAGRRS
ncbi:hypothetical protein VP1G_10558 [Cytospora mali]|uniref:Uncharacterized protein n=1 Tax=Cytospora mali TaxID=578113 RepID=A0A194UMX2_CYTMA|nr:hypothetical protein VP1G_10558 [Valsa mali var. pyri (nom. inval.)]